MGINLKNITKKVKTLDGELTILNDITLEIKDTEMVAITGKSGAGKSTLLHIIGGMDSKTSGTYFLDGDNVDRLSDRQLAGIRNQMFGYIMQDFGLINEDTVYENVMLPLLLGKGRTGNIKEKVVKKLKMLGMEDMLTRRVEKLSGGEKQRVAIARALMNNPKYILADEPTGALDSKNAKQVIDILRNLQKLGKTVIVITHDMDVANSCDRKIEIADGTIKGAVL